MSESIWLNDEDIRTLTKKQRWTAQRNALRRMQIPFTVRPDGSPVVLREHVTSKATGRKKAEPKWEAAA
jgi:hypothetical protein